MTKSINDLLVEAFGFHQRHDLAQAELLYESVLSMDPQHQDALHLLGALRAQQHRFEDSLSLIDQAIAVDPSIAAFHANRGIALNGLKRVAEAIVSFDRALELEPEFADAHNNKAIALKELGDYTSAEKCYRLAIKIDESHPQANQNLGEMLYQTEKYDEAIRFLSTTIVFFPNSTLHLFMLGVSLGETGRYEEAITHYERLLSLEPEHHDALNNLSACLIRIKSRLADSIQILSKLIENKPSKDSYINRANAYVASNEISLAFKDVDSALKIEPSDTQAIITLGICHQIEGNYDRAIEAYDKALKKAPENQDANWNKSLLLLRKGEFEQGWAAYEYGFFVGGRGAARGFAQPRWGGEELGGKRILLVSEQGFGDVLQFCRYAKRVAERGGEVVLEAPRPLLPILSGLQGVSTLVARGEPLPPFDYYCPLLSLPRIFGTRLETIPVPGKYLSSDPERVALWRERLGPSSRARVGIAWSGSALNPGDRARNIPLSLLWAHLPDRYEYISLQTEIRESDREAFAGSGIRHFGEELRDFGDTAALCELCERVISVDTSVVHLNAALGRPTWVLLPQVPDWRWLLAREDSPWYPTVRLFRQGPERTWQGVLVRVGAALAED